MITKINEFKKLFEEINNKNSDKEVKLKDYQDKINYYNSNKDKFIPILTKKQEVWEDEANKIIDGNIYLGTAWKLAKIEKTIKDNEEKLKSNELSNEEEKKINEDIVKHKQELSKSKQELLTKIKEDLRVIQTL